MDQISEELLSRYLDDDLDDQEALIFELRLEQEPQLQETYDRMLSLKGAVEQLATSMEPPAELDSLMEPLRRSRPKPRGLHHAYGLLAAAATIVIGLGIAFELHRRHPQPLPEYEEHTHVVSKTKKDGYFQLHALPTAVPGEELLGATEHLLAEPRPESPEAGEPPTLFVVGPLNEEDIVAERSSADVGVPAIETSAEAFAPDPGPLAMRAPRAAITRDSQPASAEAVLHIDGREIHRAISLTDSRIEGRYTLKLRVTGGLVVECEDATNTNTGLAAGLCSQLIGLRIDAQPDGSVDAEVFVNVK